LPSRKSWKLQCSSPCIETLTMHSIVVYWNSYSLVRHFEHNGKGENVYKFHDAPLERHRSAQHKNHQDTSSTSINHLSTPHSHHFATMHFTATTLAAVLALTTSTSAMFMSSCAIIHLNGKRRQRIHHELGERPWQRDRQHLRQIRRRAQEPRQRRQNRAQGQPMPYRQQWRHIDYCHAE
jgi:hypothetical protein